LADICVVAIADARAPALSPAKDPNHILHKARWRTGPLTVPVRHVRLAPVPVIQGYSGRAEKRTFVQLWRYGPLFALVTGFSGSCRPWQEDGDAAGEMVRMECLMNAEYERGRRDGLRLAIAILSAEEAKWASLLGESGSWRTNLTREVRHKALQVAQKRVQTALNRLTPKSAPSMEVELTAALDRLGL
jgi:hypothetical protein